MTNEEKQAIANDLTAYIGQPLNNPMTRSQWMQVAKIALAALTAQPVINDDTERMNWLVSKTVEVRQPLRYGSRHLFFSQAVTDEEDDHHATLLREQIDAAIASEVQE